MITIGSWLEKFLKENRYRLTHVKVLSAWEQVVGPHLAAISRARKIHQTTLIVDVKEQEWKLELIYHVGDILKKYQQLIPNLKIKKIYFKYDPYFKKLPPASQEEKLQNEPSPSSSLLETQPNSQEERISTEQRLDQSIKRLRQTWSALQVKRKQLSSTQPTPPVGNVPRPTKKSPRSLKIDETYPRYQIYSNFLNAKDEFQPFDLF